MPSGHTRGHRHDLLVLDHHVGQRVGIGRGERPPAGDQFDPATVDAERLGRVERGRILRREVETLALDRLGVQQHGTIDQLDLVEHLDHHVQVVTVDRPHAQEAEVIEDVGVVQRGLGHLADAVVDLLHQRTGGQTLQYLVGLVLDVAEQVAHPHLVEVAGQRALGLADRHAVVVEHHQELALQGAGVVQPLHGQPIDDRRVANQRHGVAVGLAVQLVAAGHAHRGGDAGAGVPHAEQVVLAFVRIGDSPSIPAAGPQMDRGTRGIDPVTNLCG